MPRLREDFPRATIPDKVKDVLEKLAITARGHPDCVRFVGKTVRVQWQKLLREWIRQKDIPLLVRHGSNRRGFEVVHESGRRIVMCDNSPAAWACWLAVAGETPTIAKVREWFERDEIPVAFALKSEERNLAKFRCMLRRPNVNTHGWKLCHVEGVGMKNRTPLVQIPIAEVKTAFCRLLDPGNYFLLPKSLGGLGEVEVFVNALTCVN